MNRCLLLFLLVIFPLFLSAQLERDSALVLLDADNLHQIEFADLDGDGDLDYVASLLGHNGNVQVFFNTDSQGNYSVPVTYGDTTWLEYPDATRDFDLGDMDNDGDIDIVPGFLASGSLPYLSNDGTGTFSYLGNPAETVSLRDYHYLKVVDLDQDGHLDVVSFRTGVRSLFMNRNLGNGQDFEMMEVYDGFDDFAPHYVSDFLLFDYDADGDLDMAFLSIESDPNPEVPQDLRLSIYEQTCSLCYVARESSILATGNKYIYTPNFVAGDLNGDDFPDLAVTFQIENSPMEEVHQLLILQNEAGSSSFTEVYQQDHVSKVSLSDIDRDDDLDMFAYHLERGENSSTISRRHYSIEYNLGDFNFSSTEIDERYSGDKLSCVDINQDSRPDLVSLATNFSGLVTARINTPNLAFDSIHRLNLAFGTIDQIQPEDWNEDGLMDFFFFGSAGVDDVFYDGIYRIDQSAEGVFEPPQLMYQLEGPGDPKVFIDLNNDGNLDAIGIENIYGSVLGRRLTFTVQQGDGSWTNGTAIAPEEMDAPNYYTLEDWDLDGDPDIIAISYTDNFYFLENQLSNGNGFVVHLLDLEYYGASYYREQLDSGDFNTDGYPDLMLKLNRELFWARGQNSTPSFPSWDTIPIPEGFDYPRFFLADFNQDGYTDILANFHDEEFNNRLRAISFFDPEADNFTSFLRIHTLSNVVGLGLVDDFNGDSFPDYLGYHGIRLNLDRGQLFAAPTVPSPLEDGWLQHYSEHAKVTQFTADGPRYMVAGIWSIIAHKLEYLDRSTLSGNIRWDTTGLCLYDTIYPALPNWQVSINSAEQESMAVSGFDGRYGTIFSDTGAYEITVLPPSGYWQVCPPDTLLQVSNDTSNFVANFAANALVDCPLMVVELSSTTISQCFGSAVSIGFQNAGTALAEDVTIILQHDFRLVPVNSSTPWTAATDTSVTFELGLVDIGEYGQISIHFEPSCEDLILGEQVCFIAEVTPDELCEEMQLNWDGASLQAELLCTDSTSSYRITNTGASIMSEPAAYELSQIVNDDIILYLNGTVILEPGESDTIHLPSNENYWYLALEQSNGHPYPEPIGLLNNSCQHTTDTLPRIFNSLPNGNGNPFVATLCREVIGPYDPNDKFAEPAGLTTANYIERSWPIDYTIQFQNVGTDRARNVILEDTLSPLLNLATFVPLAASHDYRWSISEDRLLRVVFTDINLPDSTSNEAGSHGFFSFQIQPAADAPFEADVLNFADIYFDFNPAIRTGTTQHRIRKPIRSGSERFSICPGESFAGATLFQDTLIREEYSFSEYDSIQFYHITVLEQPEVEVFITLDEPGMWEGFNIEGDTILTQVFTAANGCDSLVHAQIDVLTSSRELDGSFALQLHPNPAQDYTTITWQANATLRSWQLLNSLGQLIQQGFPKAPVGSLNLDTSTLPPGSYEILLEFEAGRVLRRLQIVR